MNFLNWLKSVFSQFFSSKTPSDNPPSPVTPPIPSPVPPAPIPAPIIPPAPDPQPNKLVLVADIYHEDDVSSWTDAYNAGVVGVIHKASQGTEAVDHQYALRRPAAIKEGLLWGAYHFATGADGSSQADFFLNTAKPDANTFMALDIENNPDGTTVTLSVAIAFIQRIKAVTGRLPYVYGSDVLRDFANRDTTGIIASCPLWLAEYSNEADIPSQWSEYVIWQYTDGKNGPKPHTITGFNSCDLNRFNNKLGNISDVWSNGIKQT